MGVPIINEIWQTVLHLVGRIWDSFPKPLKFVFFLFFLIFFSGFITTFIFGMNYACTTTGTLMDFQSVKDALDYNFNLAFLNNGYKEQYLLGDMTTIEHDNKLLELANPVTTSDEFNVINLACARDYGEDVKFYNPSLLFLQIDIFNYQLWLILMFFGIIMSYGWKWYDQILH